MKLIKEYMCDGVLPTKEEIVEAVKISKSENCRVRIINKDYKAILVTTDKSGTDKLDRVMEILEETNECRRSF